MPRRLRSDERLTESVQEFRKDAILRSFKGLKKEKAELEAQVAELDERSKFHDDHLRIVDAWLDQVRSVYNTWACHEGPMLRT